MKLLVTSPPNFFTPKYLGFESRPFFVDPAVFFVAHLLNKRLNPPDDSEKMIYICYYSFNLAVRRIK